MNINRDNYEEYFILFADNELSEQEKYQVENFVKRHPDLQAELSILKQSIIKPDTNLRLDDKSFLYKQENKIIDHVNYQQFFILYHDDELTEQQRIETEKFLSDNPELESEFDLFEKIKLQPNKKITFPNKKLLYKNDEDGKVVPIWWKALAAAVIAGFGIWIGVDYLLPGKSDLPVVVNNHSNKINSINPDSIEAKSLTHIENKIPGNIQTKNIASQKLVVKNSIAKKKVSKVPIKKSDILNNQFVIKNNKKLNNTLPNNKVIITPVETNNLSVVDKQEHSKNDIALINKDIHTDNSAEKLSTQNDVALNNKAATPDVFTTYYTFDENQSSDNYAFYNMPQEKFNKTKLGGLLHKVKRVIERKFFKEKTDSQETARN